MKIAAILAMIVLVLIGCGDTTTPSTPEGDAVAAADTEDAAGGVTPDAGSDDVPGDLPQLPEDLIETDLGVDDAAGPDAVEDDVPPGVDTASGCTSNADCVATLGPGPCEKAICNKATGACAAFPLPDGGACDDGDSCSTGGTCKAGVCEAGAGVVCDDGNACTTDSCGGAAAPGADPCIHVPVLDLCEDGNPCTVGDECNAAGACAPGENVCVCSADEQCEAYDDNDKCNGILTCIDNACVFKEGSVVVCGVSGVQNPCSSGGCDPATGACASKPLPNGSPCDDSDPCTTGDVCLTGACSAPGALACEDGNPCTLDSCVAGQGCNYAVIAGTCDDGNPCTVGDTCTDGECVAGSNSCNCATNADCKTLDDVDLCNGTLVCVGGSCTSDPAGAVVCDTSGDSACSKAVCDPATGTCAAKPTAEGATCDDADSCTVGDTCEAGACKPGASLDCDDDNACTTDSCGASAGSGCSHVPVADGGPCEDDSACTADTTCSSGACAGGVSVDCEDTDACTLDTCDASSGCEHEVVSGAACDDGDACTAGDTCIGASCTPGKSLACDDGEVCTIDSCDPESGCTHGAATGACDDGNACTSGDTCANGACQPGGTAACGDANDCTVDSCDAVTGCLHADGSGPCDDGNPCTVSDVCANGKCAAGAGLQCNDGNSCTSDTCDPSKGCVSKPMGGDACDDGDPCTLDDTCLDGACTPKSVNSCDDGSPCTSDSCDGGCKHAPLTGPCDDGDACTKGDTCTSGICGSGSNVECSDGSPCTKDTCDKTKGCLHAQLPDASSCNDDNPCSTGDACTSGVCKGAGGPNCDDANPCTTDSCDPGNGTCTHTANAVACNDGNPCTDNDACAAKLCQGSQKACDDGNLCTIDGCTDGKCTYASNTGPCNDGSACTTKDTCTNGICVGTAVTCNDSNVCTDDKCDVVTGECAFTKNDSPCSDGSLCTTDACSGGICVGTPKSCDDLNPCTDDTCDAGGTCQSVANSKTCDDGNACTSSDKCTASVCAGTGVNCDDTNQCTADSCQATGPTTYTCLHSNLPSYGTGCTGAGLKYGTCVGGVCRGWDIARVESNGQAAMNRTQLTAIGRPVTGGPLSASGTDNYDLTGDGVGDVHPVMYTIDETTLGISAATGADTSIGAVYRDVDGRMVVGDSGLAAIYTTSWTETGKPATGVTTPLYAVTSTSSGGTAGAYFAGGPYNATATIKGTVRRCDYDGTKWTACSGMLVAKSYNGCATQSLMDVQAAYAADAKHVWFAGGRYASATASNFATVAFHNGNALSSCPSGASGYSGEVYTDNDHLDAEWARTSYSPLRAIHGTSVNDVWACGQEGAVVHFDGSAWSVLDPTKDGIAWDAKHTCTAVYATGDDVHFVGWGNVVDSTCTDVFYLHARKTSKGYLFDRKFAFAKDVYACTPSEASMVRLLGLYADKGGLYAVGSDDGSAAGDSCPSGEQCALILRLKP